MDRHVDILGISHFLTLKLYELVYNEYKFCYLFL